MLRLVDEFYSLMNESHEWAAAHGYTRQEMFEARQPGPAVDGVRYPE